MSSNEAPAFRPKQCLPPTPAIMKELMGDVSLQVARKLVTLAPMAPGSIILDNGCGNGVVTEAITEVRKPGEVTIYATDLVPPMAAATTALAASKGWSEFVKAEAMPAEALTFVDNMFTESYNNFLISLAKEPEKVASHIYRTLKPGGVALITTWAELSHEQAVLKANDATRGSDAFHAYKARQEWRTASHLKKVLEEAGFKGENIDISQKEAFLTIENMGRWSNLAWSFLGAPKGPAGGWVEADETRFEEAVAIFAKGMEADKNVTLDGNGGAKVKMVAHIAVAKK